MNPREELPFDYQTIMKMANSEPGKKLIALVQQQSGAEVEEVISRAQAGNYSQAKELLANILNNPEASRLIKKMEECNE